MFDLLFNYHLYYIKEILIHVHKGWNQFNNMI